MSYYSEVVIVLSPNGAKEYHKRFEALNQEEQETLSQFPKTHLMRNEQELFYWSSVRWYGNRFEVNFFKDLMDDLEDEDYRFLIIGEDSNDYEEEGDFWDNAFHLEFHRKVFFSFS